MALKGFVRILDGVNDGKFQTVCSAIVQDLSFKGKMVVNKVNISNMVGYAWEVVDPEVERLSKRVAELEDTNSRLYRLITDESNRREAKRYL